MLAGDCSPGRPGLFPCLVLRPLPCASGLRHPGHCRLRLLVSQSLVARLLCALAETACGGLPSWCPQGLSLSASLLVALAASIALGLQRIFALSPWWFVLSASSCLAVMSFVSSRPSFQCWPRSRTPSQWASPGSWGPASPGRGAVSPVTGSPLASAAPAAAAGPAAVSSPSHEVAASLLRSASLRATSPRARTRSRSPAPMPKRAPRAPRRSSSVASGLRGSVALAESGLVTGLATKSCPPVPPPQLRLSRVARALHAASTESQPPAVASGSSVPHRSCPRGPSCHGVFVQLR